MRQSTSEGSSTALGTSYAVIAVSPVPERVHLGGVFGKIDTISGASSVTYYLAADAAGDHAVTATSTATIVTGATTATDGGFGEAIDVLWSAPSWGVPGALYVVAKVDAGSCNLAPAISWRGL